MATVYYADNYSVPMPNHPGVGVSIKREFLWTVITLIINDTIKLCRIPGAGTPIVITNFYIDIPDMDTSTGFVCDLGDNTTADKFVAASTVGQAAGKLSMDGDGVAAVLPMSYSTAQDFVLKVKTAASGTAATTGVIKGWLEFHYVGASTPV